MLERWGGEWNIIKIDELKKLFVFRIQNLRRAVHRGLQLDPGEGVPGAEQNHAHRELRGHTAECDDPELAAAVPELRVAGCGRAGKNAVLLR